MSQQDYFSDMLAQGEQVLAVLGAAGPSVQRKVGEERTWFQVAVTQGRFLAVKLVQGSMGGGYRPSARWAVGKEFAQIARFPRTDRTAARLEIGGLPEPIVLVDIDDPAVFPHVEPLLMAWGGVLQGDGAVHAAEVDPYDLDTGADTKQLLIVVGGGLALMVLCCGCAGLGGAIRAWVLPLL